MPNFLRATLLLSLCGVSLLRPAMVEAAPPAPADAQKAIAAAYDDINVSFGRRDVPHMMTYFTPDFVDIDEKGGKRTKDQERQWYQQQLGQIKTIQSRYTLQDLTPTSTGTQIEMHLHSEGTGEKRILFAKLHGTFTNDLHVRDLWVNTPDGWRLQHRQTLLSSLKIHPG